MMLKTIDAHVGGQPLRLVVEGFPAARGKTMLEKRDWIGRHADHLRRMLLHEPRGHRDMCGAVLTEPVSPGSHAGLLFMHNDGYATMSGHSVIAATTIALARGLLMPGGDGRTVIYDTPAGAVRARVTEGGSIVFQNVPSFVMYAGVPIRIGSRALRADVAYGGAFFAIVDAEAAGVGIDGAHLPELRRAGMAIRRAVEAAQNVAHPVEPRLCGIDATVFTGPSSDSRADLRALTVFADGAADRSPGGASTTAVMAVLDAMGLLGADAPFVQEGVCGTRFSGRLASHTTVGDCEAIVVEVEGTAWITGEHTFVIDRDDPLGGGFLV